MPARTAAGEADGVGDAPPGVQTSLLFGGRIVHFMPVGAPPRREWMLADARQAVATARQEQISDELLAARLQAVARQWGLSTWLVRNDAHELAFAVGLVG